MSQPDPNVLAAYRAALGPGAFDSLEQRGLLFGADVASPDVVDPFHLADRVSATLAGLALGDALAQRIRRQRPARDEVTVLVHRGLGERRQTPGADRVSACAQTLVLAAEAQRMAGFGAAPMLARRLVECRRTLRRPGSAVGRTVRHLGRGAPWFLAGPDSFGNMALPRAVGIGLANVHEPAHVGIAASIDAAVTHAHPRATASAAALSAIIAGLVIREDDGDPATVIFDIVNELNGLDAMEDLPRLMNDDAERIGFEPTATETLDVALCANGAADLPAVLTTAALLSGADHAAMAIAGALHGACTGMAGIPARNADVEGAAAYAQLAMHLCEPVEEGERADGASAREGAGADIWFLVDRSGSMSSIAEHVVSGFDGFFARQRQVGGEATVTVAQFDDAEPLDVIIDAEPLDNVGSIAGRFEPRGMTPLYDAIGMLLDRAERHGGVDDDQLVVILTDGLENASAEWTADSIHQRIAALRGRGWTFVFLGANQDSYAAGGAMAMPAGNVSNFAPTAHGVAASYDGLDRTVREWRGKDRAARRRDADDFWAGRKEAEE